MEDLAQDHRPEGTGEASEEEHRRVQDPRRHAGRGEGYPSRETDVGVPRQARSRSRCRA
jgi:hypothetical protein